MVYLIGMLFVLFIIALLTVYSSFSWGFVLYKFWYWFLLPVFSELPEINFWAAVGLMLFISLFKNQSRTKVPIKDEFINQKKKNEQMFAIFFSPWLVLGVGYLIKTIIS